jgi:hypothetical protein
MGQHAEVMQSRYPHACDLGQIVHACRLRIAVADLRDRSGSAMALIS